MLRKCVQLAQPIIKVNLTQNQGFLNVNNEYFNAIYKRWAGHSKWQNIQHVKEQKDKEKNIAFGRLGRKIFLAVKESGDNPTTNSKLRSVLDECKKFNMPNSTIQNCIKRAKRGALEKPKWIVYSGVGGILVAVEVGYANIKQGFAVLTPYLKKLNFKAEKSVQEFGQEKGIICCEIDKDISNAYDKALEDAIEIGIEEVEEAEDSLIFECKTSMLDVAQKKLSDKGYNIISANNELEFHSLVKVGKLEMEALQTVIDKMMKNCDEVIRVIINSEEEN